jgi:surface antigen
MVKKLLVSTALVLSLSGCLMPSGINPTNGCSKLTGCTAKDYYLPGKGVWAPEVPNNKATYGGLSGAVVGTVIGVQTGDPLIAAGATILGMVVGYNVGNALDKIDHMHHMMVLQKTLDKNPDNMYTSWSNPNKDHKVIAVPTHTEGACREFTTTVMVGELKQPMRGTACKIRGEWYLKELY